MRTVVFFLIAACVIACNAELDPPLPREKAAQVLRDVHLAENLASNTGEPAARTFGGRNPDSIGIYYRDILHHHGLTRQDWEGALAWYRNHPAELDSVYTRTVALLLADEAEAMRKK